MTTTSAEAAVDIALELEAQLSGFEPLYLSDIERLSVQFSSLIALLSFEPNELRELTSGSTANSEVAERRVRTELDVRSATPVTRLTYSSPVEIILVVAASATLAHRLTTLVERWSDLSVRLARNRLERQEILQQRYREAHRILDEVIREEIDENSARGTLAMLRRNATDLLRKVERLEVRKR